MSTASDSEMLRQRRVKRNALWLALLALGFYAAFVVLGLSRAHG